MLLLSTYLIVCFIHELCIWHNFQVLVLIEISSSRRILLFVCWLCFGLMSRKMLQEVEGCGRVVKRGCVQLSNSRLISDVTPLLSMSSDWTASCRAKISALEVW